MTSKMIFGLILICGCLSYTHAEQMGPSPEGGCLTGYMTDIQSWVLADGALNTKYVDKNNSVDLSYVMNPEPVLQKTISFMRLSDRYVRYLSLAKCGLNKVPTVFHLKDYKSRYISETVEYMTFYGNNFVSVSAPGKEYNVFLNASGAIETPVTYSFSNRETTLVWSSALETAEFPNLKQLDLRSCSIQILSPGLFRGMTNLEALYIGENKIYHVDFDAFEGLERLYHLDFSRNCPEDENGNPTNLVSDSFYTFKNLTNLVSLDLSHSKLTPRNFGMVKGLGKNLKSLSLCNTGLMNLEVGIFDGTSLEILDISQNIGILGSAHGLQGLQKSLVVLYAKDTGLSSLDIFRYFNNLQILQLANNEIVEIRNSVTETWKNLQILDLNKNRVISWFNSKFSSMPNLRLLSLQNNNINVISEGMIEDMINIDYVALSGNSLVCNCHAKDFYKMAATNEIKFNDTLIKSPTKHLYHTGYAYYNDIILNRKPVKYSCNGDKCNELEDTGRIRLIDYSKGTYRCLKVPESKSVMLTDVASCDMESREKLDYEYELITGNKILLILLVIPCLLVPLLFIFLFRRNIRYCLITMRNSAMLSLINKNEVIEDDTIFNYDVFVSYCNEDRGWVLDHLLPHIESECSISACLHERDFQVGLTILENIVACMDRSRSIMLIISQRFLLSQWCQFEMHLAQHRLLETRREDLILVLLEDIPRRLRPNTLHYLMLTKTYIVWPQSKSERVLFWRRLNKSLMSQKVKQTENVSLA